ncbi:PepSY-associated TM helix domain-containing protein [Xanthomonas citri]|uniref:PepSY-associated TM helix domain-containing protein n=1 Tax=Xanthomonas citri TaxID=346 RepID=UPI0001CEC53C|nr:MULTISPECIES: PepSY domain-containing protein [Xanthomonas]MEE5089916.1 PepSY domain-containing protein [Xanthomonas euvesicatoria]AMU97497.1 PepSY-associated TM helix domain-containing protein [Xanthomonas citri pv. aurantifolii]AMV01928.1 PepSY-associated TM helix domain-containing protein [Xanthomonas citri pv. aurantifolii]AMV05754.1 PepSY-associated TM helix domain-containing protein [Xanthomonas citri pv. aurantifolii]ARE57868.1 PepSY-associated TM helix domain-containing protein [Xan
MHATTDQGRVDDARQGSRWRFYRAVWRWHFYAGLLVLPFIIWLAVTGAAFLYQDAIDRSVHHGLKVVPIGDARLPAQQLVAAAQGRYGGSLFVYTTPKRADASAEIGLVDAHGVRQVAYVDPYRAQVLGALPEHGTLGWTIRRLHSLALVGPYARGLIEMAGGWAIVLVLTGVYLWWPRGRRGGVISVRGKPKQRLFWRDLHAVTGAGVGAILLFLALTGMPWSWLWGAQVNRWANGHDFGYPAGLRVQQPMSQQRLADSGEPAWSLRQARLPESVVPAQRTGAVDERAHGQQAHALQMGDEHFEHSGHGALPASAAHAGHEDHAAHPGQSGHAAQHAHSADNAHADHGDSAGFAAPGRGAIGLDAAMARFEARGILPGYSVAPPRGATGVYTASVYPADLQRQRVIHLDQYSGAVLLDMRYRNYGPLARLLEWGINVHLGQQYGTANQLILLLACIAIVLLCVSAAVMWWKRRPSGGLGVPPLPADPRTLCGLMALLALCGLIFPLVGLSLLLMWVFDRYWMRRAHADASAG